MNKQDAIKAMSNGSKLTHAFFSSDEWVKERSFLTLKFEDGCVCDKNTFWIYRTDQNWNEGWSIYAEKAAGVE